MTDDQKYKIFHNVNKSALRKELKTQIKQSYQDSQHKQVASSAMLSIFALMNEIDEMVDSGSSVEAVMLHVEKQGLDD